MAIDMPPVVPPQTASPVVLEARYEQAETGTVRLQIGSQTILVTGNTYLTKKQIRAAAASVKNAAQFIYLLNALYRAAGYPLVNVQYAQDPKTLVVYVRVNQGYIDEVRAPPLLAPFFEPFEDVLHLRTQDFKEAQILAGLKAKRAGVNVSSTFNVSPGEPDEFVLDMDTKPDPEHNPVTWTLTFGNPGNRFLGRYFGFTGLRWNAPNGDVLGLTYGRSFTDLGEPRGGDDYHYWQFSYSTINTWGLYGLSASYTEYQLNNQYGFNETQHSQTTTVSLQGTQFLYAADTTRWLINEKLQYVSTTSEVIEAPFTKTFPNGTVFPIKGQDIRDEQYAAFRLGFTFNHSRLIFGQIATIQLEGSYKRGFAGDIDNYFHTNRQTDFDLFAGKLKLIYRLPWKMRLNLVLKGQRSIDQELPQHEQWVLGGPGELSAYLPGILVGDTGSYGRFDFRLPVLDLGPTTWRLILFAEAGNAVYADRTGSDAAVRAVADAGVKLELEVADWLDISAYHAESLDTENFELYPGKEYIENHEADFFFNVTVKL